MDGFRPKEKNPDDVLIKIRKIRDVSSSAKHELTFLGGIYILAKKIQCRYKKN